MSESGDVSYSSDHPRRAPEPVPKRQCEVGEPCKFDGTDYPSWLPSNPYTTKFNDTYQHPLPYESGDPWEKSAQTVQDFDNGMCDAWVDEIQYMLVYAGLFSAVVGAFAVETQRLLQPDPAITTVILLSQVAAQLGSNATLVEALSEAFQDISPGEALRINALMTVSLILSLGVALLGIMVLQWIRSYRKHENLSIQDQLSVRQSKYDGLITWKVPEIITSLPIILQLSLVLFFVGLIDFFRSSSTVMAAITGAIVSLVLAFVVFTNAMPSIHAFRLMIPGYSPPFATPFPAYQSPQSWLIFRLLRSTFLSVSRIWQQHIKGIDSQFFAMRKKRWTAVTSWKDLILSSDSTVDNPQLLDKALLWLFKTFNSFESFCNTYQCLMSLTGPSFWTLHSVVQKIAAWDPPSEQDIDYVNYFAQDIFSIEEESLRRQLCVQYLCQHDWFHRRRSNPGATMHLFEVLNKGLCSILQALDALTLIAPDYPVHNSGALVKAFQSITSQEHNMVAYTDFDDRKQLIRTWLFTFVMLLRSRALKFEPYKKDKLDFNFDNFWRKLFNSRMDDATVNECITGIVAWLSDFDSDSLGEDGKHPDPIILERMACIDGFISSLWYYHIPDLEQYPAIRTFVDQFLPDAKCRRAWDKLKHGEYTYAAPPWNKFMTSLGEKYHQSLELPLYYGYNPDAAKEEKQDATDGPDMDHVSLATSNKTHTSNSPRNPPVATEQKDATQHPILNLPSQTPLPNTNVASSSGIPDSSVQSSAPRTTAVLESSSEYTGTPHIVVDIHVSPGGSTSQ
ncbi:hypothetical protein CVT24_003244 [Panaeolus cyanescens]|uniref:DUF6535 domain-containing protein n=1 Tax=Panaeolus cyanescens TaxID=181874 RepID=A0A409VUJ0_9AGAR|nr:hypothetical protein CVT24_003244 [Panaeolus cyanescens]